MIAAGAPLDVDLKPLAPGQQIVVLWRGKPIILVTAPPEALKALREPSMLAVSRTRIRRSCSSRPMPRTGTARSTPIMRCWSASARISAACQATCRSRARPTPVPNWPGGYFCPCHGSKYDLTGRVYRGVPAPYNLPVPPYHFPTPTSVRIGENPAGETFDLDSVVQITDPARCRCARAAETRGSPCGTLHLRSVAAASFTFDRYQSRPTNILLYWPNGTKKLADRRKFHSGNRGRVVRCRS